MKLIAFVYFFHFVRHGMIFPLIPLYASDLGFVPSVIGIVVSSFSLLSMLLAMPVGGLADRFGTRNMMLVGVLCNIGSSLLLCIAGGLGLLVSAQIIGGVGYLMVVVSSQAYISCLQSKGQRERAFGLITFAAAAGQAIGPFWGGFMLVRTDYLTAFAISVLLALSGLIVLGLKPLETQNAKQNLCFKNKFIQFFQYISDIKMIAILLFVFILTFSINLRTSFMPVLFKENGLDEESIGILISVLALSMTLIRLLIGKIMVRYSRIVLMLLAVILVLIGIALLPVTNQMPILALLLFFCGCGFGISQPLSMVMVSDLTSESSAGLAMGIRFTTFTAATFFSPLFFGLNVDLLGLENAFFLAAGLLAVLGLLAVRLRK